MDFTGFKDIIGDALNAADTDDFWNEIYDTAGTELDGEEMDEILRGAIILGTAPTDHPQTDGMDFVLKLRTGEIVDIMIENDPNKTPDGFDFCPLRFVRREVSNR